jgi:hypothetical protein
VCLVEGWVGWVERISLFGCIFEFGDGVNPSHVWFKELGIGVVCYGKTI